jgi:hypothetical protein
VTIKHPPASVEGFTSDNAVGKVYDVSPQLAMLMIAAGWVRSETRSRVRRHRDVSTGIDRRQLPDRRSAHPA